MSEPSTSVHCENCGGSEFANGLGSVCDECEPLWAGLDEERCEDCGVKFHIEPHNQDCDWWLPPIQKPMSAADEVEFVDVTDGWWQRIDRSDWPEHRSVDFGGTLPDGSPLMQAACPGCGLYRENDDDPSQHFIPGEGDCSWALDQLRRADFLPAASTYEEEDKHG